MSRKINSRPIGALILSRAAVRLAAGDQTLLANGSANLASVAPGTGNWRLLARIVARVQVFEA
jgi:hypothetical protein